MVVVVDIGERPNAISHFVCSNIQYIPYVPVDVVYIPRTQHYSNLLSHVPFSVGTVRVSLSFSLNN
jgi:hypothetical protein